MTLAYAVGGSKDMNRKQSEKDGQVPPTPAIISLAKIRLDGTQPRVTVDGRTVAAYAAAVIEGASFPPVVLFFDGVHYWCGDGQHRVLGFRGAGREDINALVYEGTKRDAILYAAGCNDSHGLRRSDKDKRRAVGMLLLDEEWRGWSDRVLGRACKVSPSLVGRVRASLSRVDSEGGSTSKRRERTYRTKHGTVSSMRLPEPVPGSGLSLSRVDGEPVAGRAGEVYPPAQEAIRAIEALVAAARMRGKLGAVIATLSRITDQARFAFGVLKSKDSTPVPSPPTPAVVVAPAAAGGLMHEVPLAAGVVDDGVVARDSTEMKRPVDADPVLWEAGIYEPRSVKPGQQPAATPAAVASVTPTATDLTEDEIEALFEKGSADAKATTPQQEPRVDPIEAEVDESEDLEVDALDPDTGLSKAERDALWANFPD